MKINIRAISALGVTMLIVSPAFARTTTPRFVPPAETVLVSPEQTTRYYHPQYYDYRYPYNYEYPYAIIPYNEGGPYTPSIPTSRRGYSRDFQDGSRG